MGLLMYLYRKITLAFITNNPQISVILTVTQMSVTQISMQLFLDPMILFEVVTQFEDPFYLCKWQHREALCWILHIEQEDEKTLVGIVLF